MLQSSRKPYIYILITIYIIGRRIKAVHYHHSLAHSHSQRDCQSDIVPV